MYASSDGSGESALFADSPEPSLLETGISIKISCAGSFLAIGTYYTTEVGR